MSERINPRDTALRMMETALSLLDDADERLAACYLQQAVDVLTGQTVLDFGNEVDPALVERFIPHRPKRSTSE